MQRSVSKVALALGIWAMMGRKFVGGEETCQDQPGHDR